MYEVTQRINHAVEGILGNESLTSELDDAAAKVLLDWGVTCAKMIAQNTEGLTDLEAEKAMSLRLRATRRLMRSVNKWIGNRQETDAKSHARRLSKVLEQASIIYGESFSPPNDERCDAFLKHLESMDDPAQMVVDLRRFITDPSFSLSGGERWLKRFARSLSQLQS